MVNRGDIENLAREIASQFHPERIILFGSYAYGTPRPDSDVALLVIKSVDGDPAREALEILDRLKPRFGVDILVRNAERSVEKLNSTQGKVLRAANSKSSTIGRAMNPIRMNILRHGYVKLL